MWERWRICCGKENEDEEQLGRWGGGGGYQMWGKAKNRMSKVGKAQKKGEKHCERSKRKNHVEGYEL